MKADELYRHTGMEHDLNINDGSHEHDHVIVDKDAWLKVTKILDTTHPRSISEERIDELYLNYYNDVIWKDDVNNVCVMTSKAFRIAIKAALSTESNDIGEREEYLCMECKFHPRDCGASYVNEACDLFEQKDGNISNPKEG